MAKSSKFGAKKGTPMKKSRPHAQPKKAKPSGKAYMRSSLKK